MLSLKSWLEGTGMTVGEIKFRTPPKLPYIIFRTSDSITGSDDENLVITRDVTVELYTDKIDEVSEKAITDLLDAKAFAYEKDREWIATDSFFQTTFDFTITERK